MGPGRAIDGPVIDRQGAGHDRGDIEFAVAGHGALLAGADRQYTALGRVDDGGEFADPIHAEIGNRKRAALILFGLQLTLAGADAEGPHFGGDLAQPRGQIHALGGSERLVEAVIGTRLGRSFEHEDFWITVMRWFVAHPELLPSEFGPVVDYLQHQRFESEEVFVAPGVRETQEPPRPNLSMQGRRPRALLREVERWHRSISRPIGGNGFFWEPCSVGELVFETGERGKSLRIWRIRELLSSHELRKEGAAMHHCVAIYARACSSGACSIWTLEVESYEGVKKLATIEVSSGGLITQCQARCNKAPSQKDWEMIRRWATQEGLAVAKYAGATR